MSRILDTDSTQKSDFLRSTLSILDELEWSDFDRNHLIPFQFTLMNTENSFRRGGRFLVLGAPVLSVERVETAIYRVSHFFSPPTIAILDCNSSKDVELFALSNGV